MPSSVTAQSASPPRIGVVDAVRGLACVWMIVWHTADAWLLSEIHGTTAFERVRGVGGLAAPYFFWLAGLSLALATQLRPSALDTRRGLVRAGWVIVVGYALKLFAWAVDHGAAFEPRAWPVIVLASVSMGALVLAFREPSTHGARVRIALGLAGALALVALYSDVAGLPRRPDVLARLDVLHGIGAALGVLVLVLHALGRVVRTDTARALVLGALALAVALATPLWIGASLDPLPSRIADYVARTVSDPAASGARFALFPWLGHALFGAAIGTLLRRAPRDLPIDAVPLVSRPLLLAVVAIAFSALVWEGGPAARLLLARAEWVRPVLRLAFYGTTAIGSAAVLAYVARASGAIYDGLAAMGRSSLLVYGLHLELAYGLVGLPLRGAVGWAGWVAGALTLVILMASVARRAEMRATGTSRAERVRT